MVMEKLGYDLAQLVELCGGRFSNETVGVIGLQILDHIEYLHSHGQLHLDVKPSNFMIGDLSTCSNEKEAMKMAKKIYMIDLGLACKWQKVDGTHVERRHGLGLRGSKF